MIHANFFEPLLEPQNGYGYDILFENHYIVIDVQLADAVCSMRRFPQKALEKCDSGSNRNHRRVGRKRCPTLENRWVQALRLPADF